MSHQPYIINHFTSKKQAVLEPLNLSLLIDNELFMFIIFNQNYSKIEELCHVKPNELMQHGNTITDKVRFLVNNYQLEGKKFKNVNISILNSHFTILPESFAVKENAREILEFSSGTNPKNTLTHKFNNLSFNYFIDSDLMQYLEKTFKNASIRHAGAVAINLLFNNKSLKKSDLLLNFNEGVFEIIAKENNNLLYYNVFNYETIEDVMYYLLFMMEQFSLDPNKIKLAVAGQLDAESELYKGLKKYIRNISFAVNDIKLDTDSEIKIPDHFYFTLLNQHLCEL